MKKIIIAVTSLFFLLTAHPVSAASPPTLDDYWQGKAIWEPAFRVPEGKPGWTVGFGSAAQVVVVEQNWYLFTRHIYWDQGKMTLAISKSADSGKTWSEPIDILTNTSYQEVAATDGGVYYQQSTNTWHILYQCLGVGTGWKGCHATRVASDPLGPFTPDPGNPVIQPGSIWSKICDSPQDKCVEESSGQTHDEGTFDIITFDGQYYWISFHGYDGKHGFRGIAKTSDFHTFIAGDTSQGVPNDAVLNPSDANGWNVNWNGESIGFGAGRMIYENGYWYLLAESADIDLGLVGSDPKQNWDDGIFRSHTLASSIWEQPILFKNPIVSVDEALRTTDTPAAPPEYPGIFRDQIGQIYLHVSRSGYSPKNSGIFFFKLVFSSFNPRLEAYPTVPLTGVTSRGRFKLPGSGQITNGQSLAPGDWLQLTIVPGELDWLLTTPEGPTQCPDGYHYLGSFSPNGFIDYKGIDHDNHWAVFCGKRNNVILATTCPFGYVSRGWFDSPSPSTATYDFQGNAVGGQRLNFCSNISTVPSEGKPGDLNNDGSVNIDDYNIIVRDFGHPYTIFDYNELVGNFGK